MTGLKIIQWAAPTGVLDREIQILELLAQKPVIALTINHEGLTEAAVQATVAEYETTYRRPTTDVLMKGGCDKLVAAIRALL